MKATTTVCQTENVKMKVIMVYLPEAKLQSNPALRSKKSLTLNVSYPFFR